MLSFNYQSIFMDEDHRLKIHKEFILEHYLKQFNEETIKEKQQFNCGEPCAAVCKKLNDPYKKDYEPYQALGPLCGIFDQRAAEKITHHIDTCGFDAISAGGVISWLMECLSKGMLTPEETGVSGVPVFNDEKFSIVTDSMHNANIGIELADSIIEGKGILDLSEGARKLARRLAREKGKKILDGFIYNANARSGWMAPNQYWTPGVLSPMPIMGKYYNYYGQEFIPPRELGRKNAQRMQSELLLDNMGMCRFHRKWAEDMLPEIIESLFGLKEEYLEKIRFTAGRINSRNSSVFWEPERNIDLVQTFLARKRDIEGNKDKELLKWIDYFSKNRSEAALDFWYEIHKGVQESLREF
jgi:glyceraldehyde-3-phosphate dehydrogenase (ferredoxin)